MIQKGTQQKDGPLKGHYRLGGVFTAPMNSLGNVSFTDWAGDDFPDLIWTTVLAAVYGEAAIDNFKAIQRSVLTRFGDDAVESDGITFDGRLTSLERVPAERRTAILEELTSSGLIDVAVPDELLAVLRIYEGVPGAWLLVDPLAERDLSATSEEAFTYLAQVFAKALTDDHRRALIVFPALQWLCFLKKITVGPQIATMFDKFPHHRHGGPAADAAVLTSAMLLPSGPAANAAHNEESVAWAKSFWRQNWHLTECQPAESGDQPVDESEPSVGESTATSDFSAVYEPAPGEIDELSDQIKSLFSSFIATVLDHDREVDIYDPVRHEVICGLMSRAARAGLVLIGNPDLWGGENGASTIRLFAETEIVMNWMAREGDDAIYRKYQDYGRGKAKLAHAHMTALAEAMGENAPDLLRASAEKLDKTLGGDWGAGFINVDIGATFSGKSMRDMADEVGLADTYRYVYQSASSVTHGEWWTIEDYAMQRCLNPLHKFHQIPSFNAQPAFGPGMGAMIVDRLEQLMTQAARIIFPAAGGAKQ